MALLRTLFLSMAGNRPLRRFMEDSAVGRKISGRFVAGFTPKDALNICRELNHQGALVTLDSLGENVHTEAEAAAAARVYHGLLDSIAANGIQANISVKLSQMGLAISPELTRQIVVELVDHAARLGNFVRIDMEDSTLTDVTLGIARATAHAYPGHCGVVLQAYLYRTQDDAASLLKDGIRLRLCKGAYQESALVAYPRKSDVDENYIRLMKQLLASKIYHGIATHDENMVQATLDWVKANKIAPDDFEFQMLYGVRRDLQQRLIKAGYYVRVYVPFGAEWFPYFMRRLAERPANLLFLLKNTMR